ncbi:PIG-L deacetylase family protein [Nocardioides daphniae]|uniref:GlcNAc-PI de-N-acetylase n=1 Tax=Nocardioides daphniae TaxID=402297 RepID=A0A4P7UFL9_9ACTN|nr:PIG-L deacetylase family protein [Nocardioides daphniae]QCC77629.1 PIG-L family deacetylase [Nocardioides daphniae]GGD30008.1 GlcNAc-PI de-N-acetylase [Nocardioides daphniae]
METTEQPGPLKPLAEDWERALCVVAHPDDIEFAAAGGIARWTGQGKQVGYVMVTSGEAGIDGLHPDECRPVREAEQVEAARVVGVEAVEFLGFPDGVLEYGLPLRRAIAEAVRRHQPDIVITGHFRESFGPGMLNQADHVVVGRAVVDAVRDAANRWVFPEQVEAGLEPWPGVREVWAMASPLSTHGVDTTETFDRSVEALAAHKAYIEGLGWADWDFREMLEGFNRQAGQRLGTTYAEIAEVFVLRPPTD